MATQASTSAQEPPRPSSPGSSSTVPAALAASSAGTGSTQPQTPRQQGPPGINLAGLNLPSNLSGLSDQARLALAQQAIQASQAASSGVAATTPGGMTMANASALLGGAGGGSNEAIMRQVRPAHHPSRPPLTSATSPAGQSGADESTPSHGRAGDTVPSQRLEWSSGRRLTTQRCSIHFDPAAADRPFSRWPIDERTCAERHRYRTIHPPGPTRATTRASTTISTTALRIYTHQRPAHYPSNPCLRHQSHRAAVCSIRPTWRQSATPTTAVRAIVSQLLQDDQRDASRRGVQRRAGRGGQDRWEVV